MSQTLKSVLVLMSTYNGEKYIKEQIESILNQKGIRVFLEIRDDGSIDATYDILKSYEEKNSNITVFRDEPIGVGKSFMRLLYNASEEYDYYAFADQDDVWYEDKLLEAIKCIEMNVMEENVLYCCNQNCVDMNLNFKSVRFSKDFQDPGLLGSIFNNYYAGCTMVMSSQLRKTIIDKKRVLDFNFYDLRIHDSWIVCIAHVVGKVIYDPEPHMDFRRHGATQTEEFVPGSIAKSKMRIYLNKVKRVCAKGVKKNAIQLSAENLLRFYKDFLTDEERKSLEIIAMYNNSLKNKIQLLTSDILSSEVLSNKPIIIFKIITGIL